MSLWNPKSREVWLAEKRRKQKTFFSHAAGSEYKCVGGSRSYGLCKVQFLFCNPPLPDICVSSFNFQSVRITCLLCSHFLSVLMAKDSSHTKSWAAHYSPPRTSSEPPDWAKELLKQQQANATELKHLQNEMVSSEFQSAQKQVGTPRLPHLYVHRKNHWDLGYPQKRGALGFAVLNHFSCGISGILISNCGTAVFSGPAGCIFLAFWAVLRTIVKVLLRFSVFFLPSDSFGKKLKQDLRHLPSCELLFEMWSHVKDNFASDRVPHIFKHQQILNIVAPCVQQIVSMFWIIPPPVFSLR